MTLTRDEIMQMTPERLRIEIARRKGLLRPTEDGDWLIITHGYGTTADWPTSIADVWELVEDVNTHGYTVNIQVDYAGATAYFTERGAISREPVCFVEYGNTVPLAVCRIWLLWDEERKEEK